MLTKNTAADLENVATRTLNAAKPSAINRQFLSPVEAETPTGISRWTWRSKAHAGEIASSKVGRRLLLPIAEIDRIIAEGARLLRSGSVAAKRNESCNFGGCEAVQQEYWR